MSGLIFLLPLLEQLNLLKFKDMQFEHSYLELVMLIRTVQ